MVLPIIIPADRGKTGTPSVDNWICIRMRGRHAARRLHPVHAQKHLHGVIDCMVEVWISPVTFLLTLINRSNYSISIALRHRIYALHIAGIPNADVSVT